MSSKVLITGGTGFLGRHMIEELESSDWEIFATIRGSKYHKPLSAEIRTINLESDDELKKLFSQNSIDCILHLATNYGRHGEHIRETLEANLVLPIEILTLAVDNGTKHLVTIDSFYNKPGNSQKRLFNYTQSKKALIPWLQIHSDKLAISNLVLEHMYGPNDKSDKFIPKLINSAKSEYKDGIKLSPGDQIRDFIYVEDVAVAIRSVIENKGTKKGFHNIEVGTGLPTSLKQLANTINKILNVSVPAPFGTSDYSEDEIMRSVADISYLKRLGWRPKYDLESGMSRLLDEKI